MKPKNLLAVFSVAVLALCPAGCANSSEPEMHQKISSSPVSPAASPAAQIGSPAPDFTANDCERKPRSLKDFKGKFVVLEWVNFDCPFVKKHYSSGNMQELQKQYADKDIVWISINSSAPGKQGNFPAQRVNELIKEKGASPNHYLIDSDGKVGKLYGAKTTPHIFIVDPKGTLIYAGAIDDRPSTDASDIEGASNYVRAALDQSMSGKEIAVKSTKSYGCSVKY